MSWSLISWLGRLCEVTWSLLLSCRLISFSVFTAWAVVVVESHRELLPSSSTVFLLILLFVLFGLGINSDLSPVSTSPFCSDTNAVTSYLPNQWRHDVFFILLFVISVSPFANIPLGETTQSGTRYLFKINLMVNADYWAVAGAAGSRVVEREEACFNSVKVQRSSKRFVCVCFDTVSRCRKRETRHQSVDWRREIIIFYF